jgi:hypothetical protein
LTGSQFLSRAWFVWQAGSSKTATRLLLVRPAPDGNGNGNHNGNHNGNASGNGKSLLQPRYILSGSGVIIQIPRLLSPSPGWLNCYIYVTSIIFSVTESNTSIPYIYL